MNDAGSFPGNRNNCNGWPVKCQKGNLPKWALKNWLVNVYGGLYYPWLQELTGEFQANQTNQKNWAVVSWSFWLPNCPLDEGLLTSQQKDSFSILHQSAWTEWRKAMVLFSKGKGQKNTTVHRIFRNSHMITIMASTKATQLWSSTPSSPGPTENLNPQMACGEVPKVKFCGMCNKSLLLGLLKKVFMRSWGLLLVERISGNAWKLPWFNEHVC